MDCSSHHGLDPVSISPVASSQFLKLRLLRLYHDSTSTMGCAVLRSHVFGLCCTGAWSRDVGVLRGLKFNLGNTRVT